MKILTTLLFIFFSLSIFAQTHSELIQKADKFYQEKAYSESANTFAAAFKIKEGNNSEYYNAACSAALAGQEEQALNFLEQSAKKGWRGYDHMHKDNDLSSLWEKDAWKTITEIVQANITEYEKDFDKELKSQLEDIYVKDQTLRKLSDVTVEKFGAGSEEAIYLWDLIAEQDSLCMIEVAKIIEKHGWPGRSLVGNKANTTVFLVVQHSDLTTQEKYLPLLKESVKIGESRGSQLALLEDRIEMYNERPQIYGSQMTRNKETGGYQVYNLKDPKTVDKRRAEVGLEPLADYAKRFGVEWSIEDK